MKVIFSGGVPEKTATKYFLEKTGGGRGGGAACWVGGGGRSVGGWWDDVVVCEKGREMEESEWEVLMEGFPWSRKGGSPLNQRGV